MTALVELLVLAAVGGAVGLATLAGAIYLLIQATSVATVVLIAVIVIIVGGTLFVMLWLWTLEHWDGAPWRELANAGREGEILNVTTADGVRLHVEVEGPEQASVTVVFCHGLAMNASAWRYQRAAMRGNRVVSYDARGHGKSGTGKLDQSIRGVRQLADDLGRVIDAAAPTGRLVIVGHSMGSVTAVSLAAARPDLVERIGGYVLCSGTAGPLGQSMTFGLWKIFSPVSWLMRRECAAFLMLIDALPRFVGRIMGLFPYLLGLRFFAVHRRGSLTALRPTAAIVYDNGFRQSGDLVLALQDCDERAGLAAMRHTQVAVIGGRNDRIVPPSDQEYLGNNIPGAQLTMIDRCGHQSVFEDAEVINAELKRIVEFVGRGELAPSS